MIIICIICGILLGTIVINADIDNYSTIVKSARCSNESKNSQLL